MLKSMFVKYALLLETFLVECDILWQLLSLGLGCLAFGLILVTNELSVRGLLNSL